MASRSTKGRSAESSDHSGLAGSNDFDDDSTRAAEVVPVRSTDPRISMPPAASIGRMSLYLRELRRLEDADVLSINSRDLAKRINVSAAIVRRDLAMLGSVGKRGVGYDVESLAGHLRSTLGSDNTWRVALVGTGSLGQALLRYPGFERLGFRLVAALDIDASRIGAKIAGITIRDAAKMNSIFRQVRPQLAILAVPADVAAAVAVQLARAGIRGILNFAPTSLKLPPEIGVVNVDLASEMQRLAFHVSQRSRQIEIHASGE